MRDPTNRERQRIPRGEIGTDLLVEQIIVQEGVEVTEGGIGVISQFRHSGEDVFMGASRSGNGTGAKSLRTICRQVYSQTLDIGGRHSPRGYQGEARNAARSRKTGRGTW